jgi:DHA2 family multidrug resistance protein-like MFS transporter
VFAFAERYPLHHRALGLSMLNSFIPIAATFSGLQLALPEMMEDFNVPITTAVWIMLGNTLALAGGTLALSGLTRYFDRRTVALAGMGADALLMLLIFFTPSVYVVIVARFFQGISRIFPFVVLQVAGIGGFPAEKRGHALGLNAIAAGLGIIVSLPLTGLALDTVGWRWLFFGSSIAMFALMLLTVAFLPSLPPEPGARKELAEFDFLGSGLLMGGIIALATAAQLFIRDAGSGALLPLLATLGAGAIVAFVLVERRAAHPVLPWPLFRAPAVAMASGQSMVMGFINGAFLLVLPFLFIQGYGWSAAYASSILLFQNLTRPFTGPVAGRLADRHGSAAVILPSAAVSVLAQAGLALVGAEPVLHVVVGALLFWGTSQALMQTANMRQLFTSMPGEHLHLAPSLNLALSYVGGTCGQMICALLVDRALADHEGGTEFATALTPVLLLVTGVFAAGIVITQLLPRLLRRYSASRKEAVAEAATR